LCELVAKFLEAAFDEEGSHGARHAGGVCWVYAWERRGRWMCASCSCCCGLCGVNLFEWDVNLGVLIDRKWSVQSHLEPNMYPLRVSLSQL
jgi:hypothetical protein